MHAYTHTCTKTHTLTLQPIPMHANELSVLTKKKIAVCIKQSHQHTVHKQHIPLLTHFCFSSRAKHSHSHTRVHAHTHKLHTSTSASQKKRGIFNLFFSFSLSVRLWRTLAGIGEKRRVARRQVVVAMANLSGTAGPISIKCGREGAEPRRLMPTQTDRKERLLRHAEWRRRAERREESRGRRRGAGEEGRK